MAAFEYWFNHSRKDNRKKDGKDVHVAFDDDNAGIFLRGKYKRMLEAFDCVGCFQEDIIPIGRDFHHPFGVVEWNKKKKKKKNNKNQNKKNEEKSSNNGNNKNENINTNQNTISKSESSEEKSDQVANVTQVTSIVSSDNKQAPAETAEKAKTTTIENDDTGAVLLNDDDDDDWTTIPQSLQMKALLGVYWEENKFWKVRNDNGINRLRASHTEYSLSEVAIIDNDSRYGLLISADVNGVPAFVTVNNDSQLVASVPSNGVTVDEEFGIRFVEGTEGAFLLIHVKTYQEKHDGTGYVAAVGNAILTVDNDDQNAQGVLKCLQYISCFLFFL